MMRRLAFTLSMVSWNAEQGGQYTGRFHWQRHCHTTLHTGQHPTIQAVEHRIKLPPAGYLQPPRSPQCAGGSKSGGNGNCSAAKCYLTGTGIIQTTE